MEDENVNGKTSEFNSAIDYVKRIAALQESLDELRCMNLYDIPYGLSQPVYMLRLKMLTSLWMEILSKASQEEKEDVRSRKKYTENYIKSHPPVKVDHNGKVTLINEHIETIDFLLERLEETLREIIESHGLNSPNKLSEGGYD
jgi:hypothetical protein